MGKNNKVFMLPPRGRNLSKLTSPKYAFDNSNERNENATLFTVPEHVDLPELSDENELLYEMQTIVIFIIAMSTQYLNLYRTFWWMPDTYRRYAMVNSII
ncbi:hypothetical protein SSS_05357 [Sarcoptes scabiei]|nr:hypothetical protein SSS_05357 [Sarcoptes scabiei]